jgi:hypothetical protein
MADPVELSVRSSLKKILDELDAVAAKGRETGDAFKQTGDTVGDELGRNVKKSENFFVSLRNLSRRAADQIRGDFKSLIALNALTDAVRLNNLFRQSVSESVALSDSIRKLGNVFGIAGSDFAKFQTKMTEGLGEIGLSSEVATNALKGLSTTNVRGPDNLLEYSKDAGMLASIGGEKGREGDIAKGMADAIQARGGNVNDAGQASALAENLRKIFNATGMSPTQALSRMNELFESMPEDFRKSISSSGLAEVIIAGIKGGPNSTKFIEDLLGKSPLLRKAFEAQGGAGIVTDKGINLDKFERFANSIFGRIPGDKRASAKTVVGDDDAAAEGFVRLAENIGRVREAQRNFANATGDLRSEFHDSMGAVEAFSASLNRLKAKLAAPLAEATQGATNLLTKASETDLGAGGVVAVTATVGAVLAGLGLKGVGQGLGMVKSFGALGADAARVEAAEQIFGAKVQPVYVVNVAEFGGGLGGALGGGAGGAVVDAATGVAGGGLMGFLTTIAAPVAAVFGGAAMLNHEFSQGEKEIMKKPEEATYTPDQLAVLKKRLEAGQIPDAREDQVRKILEINHMLNAGVTRQPNGTTTAPTQTVRHVIELNENQLKASKQPARGASF